LEICPPECELTSYDTHSSFSTYPNSENYENLIKVFPIIVDNYRNENVSIDQIDYDRLKLSVSCAYIYFSDLKYVYIEQSPTRLLVDLLSSLGGTLGLFTGISFLSFVEIFELSIEIFYIFIDKKRNYK
jgi:hypothetical protein